MTAGMPGRGAGPLCSAEPPAEAVVAPGVREPGAELRRPGEAVAEGGEAVAELQLQPAARQVVAAPVVVGREAVQRRAREQRVGAARGRAAHGLGQRQRGARSESGFCRQASAPEKPRRYIFTPPLTLRKAGARRLAEAGATEWEVTAFLALRTAKEASRFTAAANRSMLTMSSMARLSTKPE